MKLTIDQALIKGVEAHKAGKLQEADRHYTAILKAQPKHPDANHNMGVLTVGLGKVQEALSFFKTALDANPSIAQFWLSYIDALIKLNRVADAKAVLNEAKSKGIKGDGFEQIEKRLVGLEKGTEVNVASNKSKEPPEDQLQNLINLYTQGLFQKALVQGLELLKYFPNSSDLYNIIGAANKGLGKLDEAIEAYNKSVLLKPDYAEAYNNMGIVLQDQGKLERAVGAYKKAIAIESDFAEAYNNMGTALQDQGKLKEAIEAYNKAVTIQPDYANAYNNMGTAQKKQGKLDKAIVSYTKALVIKPDYAEVHNNMGTALKDQGKLVEAVEAYNKALVIKPKYAEVYNNMGVALKNQGKLGEAIEAFKNAISTKPDNIDAYYNMGNALKKQGKLEEAIEAYKRVLSIQPDYAEANNNLGIALNTQGKLEEAMKAYHKALSFKPDYFECYWNLYGTSRNIKEAKKWIEKCLKVDPNHEQAKLTLSALKFYEGDKSEFRALVKSAVKDHPYMRSFNWAFSLPKLPLLHFHRWALFDQMTKMSKKNRPFYEFGVWRGEAFKHLIRTFKKGYGFDTFEGLPEDWHNEKAGTYSSEGNIPNVDGGEFIVGKFEDTLPDFFSETRPMASIINFDADLYSSTICALNYSKSVIDEHTILIFDEFIMNKNWEEDEYKALEEFCSNNHFRYEVLAISFFTAQVAVRLIAI